MVDYFLDLMYGRQRKYEAIKYSCIYVFLIFHNFKYCKIIIEIFPNPIYFVVKILIFFFLQIVKNCYRLMN